MDYYRNFVCKLIDEYNVTINIKDLAKTIFWNKYENKIRGKNLRFAILSCIQTSINILN